jgi:hypothetical protein
MAVRYPELPQSIRLDQLPQRRIYEIIEEWGAALINDLDTRDQQVDATPSTNIFSVVCVTSIGRPQAGNIVYAASRGKFVGYVSLGAETSWHDLN